MWRNSSLLTIALLLLCISPFVSFSAELCFCPERPKGDECNNQCKNNPGGVIVLLPKKPEQPDTNPFEHPDLWSSRTLEEYRSINEKNRILLEIDRRKAEKDREIKGSYPPSLEYKKNMSDYFDGIEHYRENMRKFRIIQKAIQRIIAQSIWSLGGYFGPPLYLYSYLGLLLS